MASDPRKLKPSELCRLLNSTPLGEVISERQLYRHRQRAGARIGDNKTVDLLRYCAWMHVIRHTPRTTNGVDPYDAMKERARARNAALALAGRDIGELPEVDTQIAKIARRVTFDTFVRHTSAHVSSCLVAGPYQGHQQDRASGCARRFICTRDGSR